MGAALARAAEMRGIKQPAINGHLAYNMGVKIRDAKVTTKKGPAHEPTM